MPNLPWFKVYTEINDNYKLRSLSYAQKWRFLQLLALAGECGSQGYLVHSGKPLQANDLAWRLRIDTTEMLQDLQALVSQDLIRFDEASGTWLIPGFAGRQARSDEGARAYWREQKRRKRGTFKHPVSDDLEEALSTPPDDLDPMLDMDETSPEGEEAGQLSMAEPGLDDENGTDSNPRGVSDKDEEYVLDTLQENVPLNNTFAKNKVSG